VENGCGRRLRILRPPGRYPDGRWVEGVARVEMRRVRPFSISSIEDRLIGLLEVGCYDVV
jgi:hypothetical protein